jgi:hypothetical protein
VVGRCAAASAVGAARRTYLAVQRKSDFQRDLPVAKFSVFVNVTARFGHLEPPHVTNGLFCPLYRVANCFIETFRRRTDQLYFFVNVIAHKRILRSDRAENN